MFLAAPTEVVTVPFFDKPVVQLVILVLVIILGWVAKRYTDPMKRLVGILEGSKSQPDARQMLEQLQTSTTTIQENTRAARVSSEAALQVSVGVSQDLRVLDARVQGQIVALDKKVVEEVGTLRRDLGVVQGRVDGHDLAMVELNKDMRDLRSEQAVQHDLVGRIETIVKKRSGDQESHEAATDHLKKPTTTTTPSEEKTPS